MSEHRHVYVPSDLDPGYQRCLNARHGCDVPQRKTPTRPAPAQEHSETSKAAARSIDGKPRHRDRIIVFQAFQKAGSSGLTDEELIEATSLPANTARPRRIDLLHERVVIDTGRRRDTRSGRAAVVWALYDAIYGGEPLPLVVAHPADTIRGG